MHERHAEKQAWPSSSQVVVRRPYLIAVTRDSTITERPAYTGTIQSCMGGGDGANGRPPTSTTRCLHARGTGSRVMNAPCTGIAGVAHRGLLRWFEEL